MKKIIFVRHGRAEDPSAELTDFERSLTTKGKVISRQMARRFREKESDAGLIITSPAFRALETAFVFASAYLSKPFKDTELFEIIGRLDDHTNTITLFGHNPAFTEMPDRLSKSGCEFLTKTSVVCVSFKTDSWSGVKLDSGKEEYFL